MPGTTEEARPLKSGGSLSGHVRVPGDKSISHRALLFGAIAEGQTTIEGLLPAEDPISTAACLRAMGVTISPIKDGETITVQGVGLDGLQEPSEVLDCGNSGTTMRLMLGLLAGRDGRHFVLSGDASLRRRPMQRVGSPCPCLEPKSEAAEAETSPRWRRWSQAERGHRRYPRRQCASEVSVVASGTDR